MSRLNCKKEKEMTPTFLFFLCKSSCSLIFIDHRKVQVLVWCFLRGERHFKYGQTGFHVPPVSGTIFFNSPIPLWAEPVSFTFLFSVVEEEE